ncbi:AVAST type 1 anti-phage system MBL fold metallo-hydrolase Avs1a [Bernardetia sp. OM2101]|uniref:AVAST type 1 anti-phage system MBL fold metallo-hydrolase Avs1a n=1 Tax=Bernardetia sp. OM2101 TaxID=3344876 RepID=UPI0035CF4D67
MSEIQLKIYPALDGDSFLLSIEDTHILIDGGYVSTYNDHIKNDLITIHQKNQLLSHVIITHIDRDHISGIVKFLEENNKDRVIEISNIWHNAYRHLPKQASIKKELISLENKSLINEIKGGSYLKNSTIDNKNISSKQGSSLGALILEGGYSWNSEFGNKAIAIENLQNVSINEEIELILLSPNNEKLQKLEKAWKKDLERGGYKGKITEDSIFDDAFEFMIAKQKPKKYSKEQNISSSKFSMDKLLESKFIEDATTANGSSLAFIIKYKDKNLLFLGDSHPSLVLQQLKKYYNTQSSPIYFDLIKVSHHGSWNNTSPELLSFIDSENIIFSTNGKKHSHPHSETIANFISRKCEFKRKLYFNYTTSTSQLFDQDMKSGYNYEIITAEPNQPLILSI